MDPGTLFGYSIGYLAILVGIFLLYLPHLLLFVALLLAAGILQLLLLPFALLIRKLRRKRHQSDQDRLSANARSKAVTDTCPRMGRIVGSLLRAGLQGLRSCRSRYSPFHMLR